MTLCDHSTFKRIRIMIICLNTILTFCHIVKISDSFLVALIYTLGSCLTKKKKKKKKKKENGKITQIGKSCGLYYDFVHLGDSLAYR